MLRFFFAFLLISFARANYQEEYLDILQRLWDAFEKTEDGYVGRREIIEFFYRYNDEAKPTFLDIREEEFCGGNVSFITDFQVTAESCVANFKLNDLTRFEELGDVFERITEDDVENIFFICDLDLDGWLSETEWTEEFQYAYRPLPFAAMFIRYRAALGTGWYDDYISLSTWLDLWGDFANEDLVTADVTGVTNFWVSGGFGNEESGNFLFNLWDIDRDGILTIVEWDQLYETFDYYSEGVIYYNWFVYIHDNAMHP